MISSNKIKIHNCNSYEIMSRRSAEYISGLIESCKKIQIGISTGYSPKLFYQLIAEFLSQNPELRNKISIIQLDEWFGLNPGNECSCAFYMTENVVVPWGLKKSQVQYINGDIQNSADRVEKLKTIFDSLQLDVCILGLGKNGHLALNEPGSSIDSEFRKVALTEESMTHNMLKKSNTIIDSGISIGIKEILRSNEILLLAAGTDKKVIFDKIMYGHVSKDVPATYLLTHKNVQCYVDDSAIV